jgi:hypothetical protein
MDSSWSSKKKTNPKRLGGTMDQKGMKEFLVMIILLMTLFLVLKHAEGRPLPFSATNMPSSLHRLPVPAQLLSFSPNDDGIRLWKKLKFCYKHCGGYVLKNVKKHRRFFLAYEQFKDCLRECKEIIGIKDMV